MKVLTVVGTRPEIIRLSRLISKLDGLSSVDHRLAHTGQNYDYELNEVFFEQLGIRQPDHFLEIDTTTLGTSYGDLLIKSEILLREEQPDAVAILGDTNSALTAVMARRMNIPVFHMEAGNRCFDWRVPEETNRRIVDSISTVNLVYSEHARRNLLREGHHPSTVFLTGSPMSEVLNHYREPIDSSQVVEKEGLSTGEYFVVSLHRQDNVDDPNTLRQLFAAVVELTEKYEIPAVVSVHPRTARRLEETGLDPNSHSNLILKKPFGFLDYVSLQMRSKFVLSDSGTISEESAILEFPAVSPRRSMERPEALDAGTLVTSGTDSANVQAAVEHVLAIDFKAAQIPAEYRVQDFSQRVVSVLLSRALFDTPMR